MKVALVAAALALLVGCAFPDGVVRKRAANDFPCPEDEIVVHRLEAGWLARGCKKEADYVVQDGRALRTSEITRAKVDERPELPIVGRIRRVLATGSSLPCRTMRSRPARGRARHRPRRELPANAPGPVTETKLTCEPGPCTPELRGGVGEELHVVLAPNPEQWQAARPPPEPD